MTLFPFGYEDGPLSIFEQLYNRQIVVPQRNYLDILQYFENMRVNHDSIITAAINGLAGFDNPALQPELTRVDRAAPKYYWHIPNHGWNDPNARQESTYVDHLIKEFRRLLNIVHCINELQQDRFNRLKIDDIRRQIYVAQYLFPHLLWFVNEDNVNVGYNENQKDQLRGLVRYMLQFCSADVLDDLQ